MESNNLKAAINMLHEFYYSDEMANILHIKDKDSFLRFHHILGHIFTEAGIVSTLSDNNKDKIRPSDLNEEQWQIENGRFSHKDDVK